jgi:hypothetical protein
MEVAMPKLTRTLSRRQIGSLTAVLTGVLALVGAPAMAAVGSTTATSRADTSSVLRTHQQDAPFLFSYVFSGHLVVAGGDFTMGGRVYLTVREGDGTSVYSRTVVARPHAVTPGGAIYVQTPIPAPCARNNGYARAYDYTTRRWTRTLPVGVCKLL